MLTCHHLRMSRTGAKQEDEAKDRTTPLQAYEKILSTKLPDYSMANLSISSVPLPETRSRVWIIGSRSRSFPASTWKSLVLHLETKAKEMTPHHFLGLAGPPPVVRTAKPTREQQDWERDAEYHAAFKKAFQQAAAAGRLGGKDTKPQPKPKEMRASAKAKCKLTPRQMAAVDVSEQIIEIEKSKYETPSTSQLADISQSSCRGQIVLHGLCKTQTTSMRRCVCKKCMNFAASICRC